MNRFLIPLLILLGSLLFSWHWNCNRKPSAPCFDQVAVVDTVTVTQAPIVTDTVVATPEEKLLMEPLDVYFNSGKAGINRTPEIEAWLAQAKKYLEKNPSEKLSVTGHTDSDGDDASNVILSGRRAETMKGILIKDGFGAANLEPSGKGEAEPVASNDTEDGKAKNRRVSIRLIK